MVMELISDVLIVTFWSVSMALALRPAKNSGPEKKRPLPMSRDEADMRQAVLELDAHFESVRNLYLLERWRELRKRVIMTCACCQVSLSREEVMCPTCAKNIAKLNKLKWGCL